MLGQPLRQVFNASDGVLAQLIGARIGSITKKRDHDELIIP